MIRPSSLPTTSQGWAALAHTATQLETTIAPEELLIVRDAEGRHLRSVGPPPGMRARLGAVLLLLFPQGGDLCLPLTVRSEHLPHHSGEVSLPGGATDPGDSGPTATALRECEEEIGVPQGGLAIWGEFAPIYILPSNFQVTPVVAYSQIAPQLYVNPYEVSDIILVTLRDLLDPAMVLTERRTLRGMVVDVPYFAIGQQKVWGATALVLSEFTARMRRVLADG